MPDLDPELSKMMDDYKHKVANEHQSSNEEKRKHRQRQLAYENDVKNVISPTFEKYAAALKEKQISAQVVHTPADHHSSPKVDRWELSLKISGSPEFVVETEHDFRAIRTHKNRVGIPDGQRDVSFKQWDVGGITREAFDKEVETFLKLAFKHLTA